MIDAFSGRADTSSTWPARPVASVRSAVKSFQVAHEPVRGLQGFDIDLYPGEVCALVGVSGSGKSTLLSVLGGLTRLDSGSVIVDGADVSALSKDALANYRAETVSSIFQEYNLLPMLTCLENVALAGYLVGTDPKIVKAAAEQSLTDLGLQAEADRYPGELSGGQRQRVAIARAIAGQSHAAKRMLLADEPSGSLDSATTRDVLSALRRAAESGLAVLVATHDPLVVDAADRVVTIRDGKNIENAPADGRPRP